jgi:hypothetical protein
MKIDKNSWHYKVWEDSFENPYRVPRSTSLCPYFWRVVGALAWVPARLVLLFLFWSIAWPVITVVLFSIGFRPITDFSKGCDENSKWKPLRVWKIQFYPAHVMFVAGSAYFWHGLLSSIVAHGGFKSEFEFFMALGFVLLLTGLLGSLVFAASYIDPTHKLVPLTSTPEAEPLVISFLRAKKENICPLLEFVSSDETSATQKDPESSTVAYTTFEVSDPLPLPAPKKKKSSTKKKTATKRSRKSRGKTKTS